MQATQNTMEEYIERQKAHFKNHVASFTDYGKIKILDFKDPKSSNYRIRFLFEEDYCKLHISGDLGELIATNYSNMTFDKFSDFVNNTGYFKKKIDCHNRAIYCFDEDKARQKLKEYFEENDLLDYVTKYSWESDEEKLEDILDEVLADFSTEEGIGPKGYEVLSDIDETAWEWVANVGKEDTGILELYMLAFKLAKEQLK